MFSLFRHKPIPVKITGYINFGFTFEASRYVPFFLDWYIIEGHSSCCLHRFCSSDVLIGSFISGDLKIFLMDSYLKDIIHLFVI